MRTTLSSVLVAFTTVALSTANSAVSTQPEQRDYKSSLSVLPGVNPGLRGLRAFTFQVRPFGTVSAILHQELQRTLATTLRESGAKVLLPAEPGFNETKESLTVLLQGYSSPDRAQCSWGVDIDFHQPVQLLRDPSIQPSNTLTWHTSRQGIVPCTELDRTLRTNALDLVQQLAWVYKTDNER